LRLTTIQITSTGADKDMYMNNQPDHDRGSTMYFLHYYEVLPLWYKVGYKVYTASNKEQLQGAFS